MQAYGFQIIQTLRAVTLVRLKHRPGAARDWVGSSLSSPVTICVFWVFCGSTSLSTAGTTFAIR